MTVGEHRDDCSARCNNVQMTAPLALSFDLDDTLWPVAPVIAAAENTMFAWLRERHPHTVGGHDMESLRALRAAVAERFPQHAHDMTFLRRRSLQELFAAADRRGAPAHEAPAGRAAAADGCRPEALADEALEVFLEARNRVRLYEDVRPALERLRARYPLFAISNGNADLQRCGIGDLFAGHVTASAAGAAKPDARIFAQLLRMAGVAPAQLLHIGDDPLADVVGATRAGMQAAWLNRDARPWPAAHPAPVRTISTLAQLD
jgi:putative hydrolase of the HAD superfamily